MEPPRDHHHQQEEEPSRLSQPHTTCPSCGGPTRFPPPPNISATPSYIPIRFPAVNLPNPPTNSKEAIIRTPVPQPQKVDPISPPYHFTTPSKIIRSQDDIVWFHSSPIFHNFLGFVVSLSESIKSHKLSDPCHVSSTIEVIISILQTLSDYVDEIPPAPQSSRYGNVAYRAWHERISSDAESFMLTFLPPDLHGATVELVPYFTDSFGNSSRIDYGTGHETNFAAWLYCLARLGIVKEEDYPALVARVFVKYMDLMRKLQLTYSLEPAGSHGVWGLDDYHFLPFIFGSSQLIDHKHMKPKSIHNDDILENFANEYLYLSCIVFVKKAKKGLFAEHSPLLDDISGVPTWNKVNSGMLKMYKVEVLEKVPIMQHFLFGSIIKWV
ncbi:serine/threonine-protein phosphatase 2A activator isoform X2 [Olea europaea var. sylvestris]|uniref:serine/threonine-protein phosphatase 2A activator isoform X2 n=1 Tax=Olea europaea var. sylvestris TaxID=158386 RepID=UPI000C1CF0B2|nr:serine/threonine-protein phosphatase 2A activator isoform X2 [Olea europaea var. sylvestris]XP_022865584.1 serine/threonine-protein phosphatase 2A activator isoform X2 [Olea europaea var. sylvestris]